MPKDSYASGPSSNPSSKSYSGGGGGGVSSGKTTSKSSSGGGKGGSLGVTTGKTIYGNTAFGPAGGNATGYATRTGNISGTGPSMTTFSNFRTPSGGAMFSGRAGNTPVTARNAQQAAGMLSAMQAAQGRRNGFGMLSGDPVTVGPIPVRPRIVPMAFPIPKPRPPGLATDLTWQNFQGWWNDPVTLKYSNPYTFGSNPAVYTPGPKPGQYGPQIPDNPAVYTPGPKPGQYGPQRPDPTPQGWKDFSNSVGNFLGTMRAR